MTEQTTGNIRVKLLEIRRVCFSSAIFPITILVFSAELPCRTFCKAVLVKSIPKIDNLN